MKTSSLLVVLLLFTLFNAASQTLGEKPCNVKSVTFATGVNPNNSLIPVGNGDPAWSISNDPTGLFPPSAPLWVISPHSAWSSLTGAQWVSPFPIPNLSEDNPEKPYTIRYCFCVKDEGSHNTSSWGTLSYQFLVDDWISEVRFNGTPVATYPNPTIPPNGPYFQNPPTSTSVPVPVSSGRLCMEFDLHNLGGVAMGFSCIGSLTLPSGSNFSIGHPSCCNDISKICGFKYRDINNDGDHDFNEPGLSGWEFNLSGPTTQTITTDESGYFCFNNLPAGSYSLSETLMSGWYNSTANNPTSLTLSTNDVQFIEFGNNTTRGPVDISVVKTWELTHTPVNNEGRFKIVIKNESSIPAATNIHLTDTYPAFPYYTGHSFGSVLPGQITTYDNTTGDIFISSLAPGDFVILYITTTSFPFPNPLPEIENCVDVISCIPSDGNPLNNHDCATPFWSFQDEGSERGNEQGSAISKEEALNEYNYCLINSSGIILEQRTTTYTEMNSHLADKSHNYPAGVYFIFWRNSSGAPQYKKILLR